MDGCKGLPEQRSYRKPCPLRSTCARFALHMLKASDRPNGYYEMYGPYDFEDEECGQFIER